MEFNAELGIVNLEHELKMFVQNLIGEEFECRTIEFTSQYKDTGEIWFYRISIHGATIAKYGEEWKLHESGTSKWYTKEIGEIEVVSFV